MLAMTVREARGLALKTFVSGLAMILVVTGSGIGSTSAAPPNARTMLTDLYTHAFGTGDVAALTSLTAPDAITRTPEGNFVGADGIGQFAARFDESFSNIQFTVVLAAMEGDVVMLNWFLTASHTGPYENRLPACTSVALHGYSVLRFGDSQIVEHRIDYDRLALLDQIDTFARIVPESRPGCDALHQ